MIIFEIDQTERAPIFVAIADLGDNLYTIQVRWLDRREGWYLDLFDAAGDAILRSHRLAVNNYVGLDLQDERLPPGKLGLVELESTQVECGYDDLGDRCKLHYFEPDEVIRPEDINIVTQTYLIEAVP